MIVAYIEATLIHSCHFCVLCYVKPFSKIRDTHHPPNSLNAEHCSSCSHIDTDSEFLQEFGSREHFWQTAVLSWDTEVWASDNPGPNVSLLCKQIPPIGPIQNTMKNHRRQISQSKPSCEREDWKDMKALARILAHLSPSCSILSSYLLPSSPPPLPTGVFAQHPLIWGISWPSQSCWGTARQRSESPPEPLWIPVFMLFKKVHTEHLRHDVCRELRSLGGGQSVSPSKTVAHQTDHHSVPTNRLAFWRFSSWYTFIIHQSWLVIGFKMIFFFFIVKKKQNQCHPFKSDLHSPIDDTQW